MDDIVLYPEDYYYGVEKVKSCLELIKSISKIQLRILSYCKETNVDISGAYYSTKRIHEKLEALLSKLLKIKKIMINMDPSIEVIYNELDNKKYMLCDVESNLEERINLLKGNNEDTGAILSLNSRSIFNELNNNENINKLLDNLKNKDVDTGAITSTNIESILNVEV